MNGLDALALTKLDVLDAVDEVKICVGYQVGDRSLSEFPADPTVLAECAPQFESMPGWSAPTAGVTRFEELPVEAQRYVTRLEELTGVPIAIVSTGSDRGDTIVRDGSLVSEWLG